VTVPRGTALLQCLVCQRIFRRESWPLAYGPSYIYGGICPRCRGAK
jgi:hypothetical protein